MLQIGICDDEKDIRLHIRWMLERILEERGIEHHLLGFPSGEMFLQWLEQHKGEMDLVFLDIEMDGMNGMEVAKRIRKTDTTMQIVFVTGYADFVFEGYEVGALGYLLKPPKQEQISDVISRTLAVMCRQSEEVYTCRNGENHYRIPQKEILYFVSDKRQIHCKTLGREYVFYGKLDEVEQELLDKGFIRIHQRYLVRAAAVTCVCQGEVQIGEQVLPISRSYQKEVLLVLTRASLEE